MVVRADRPEPEAFGALATAIIRSSVSGSSSNPICGRWTPKSTDRPRDADIDHGGGDVVVEARSTGPGGRRRAGASHTLRRDSVA